MNEACYVSAPGRSSSSGRIFSTRMAARQTRRLDSSAAPGALWPRGPFVFEVAYETTFCATHALAREGRPIEPLHGHDWRVEVVAAAEALDPVGVVVDFEQLKKAVGEVAARFHYKDIGAHPSFAGRSPSAEAVARYFFDEVRAALGSEGRLLSRVRVWEAPGCSATYSG
jgi:6-pyruvoyltetrahydropterin/6-carboxytetrahydropterin synthase